MSANKKPLGITEVVLRDAHQSLFATRLRIDDMIPIAEKLDRVGFWSVESWGGATFDACIRFLGEDPWERIRKLKAAMPKTRQQMLLRGQNLLGYRHYADDVVVKFVERAAVNGVDVFRIFDAMNDVRNLKTAVEAVRQHPGKHAQGAISYTESPVHTIDMWVDLAKRIEDLGAHSIVIKDMSGLLKPYVAAELVSKLKKFLSIEIHLHCHATTGLSLATAIKAIDAGVDNLDTAISSMSMTYGHSPTETIVAALEETDRDTGLDLKLLEEVAAYFREVRKKYRAFEGSLSGIDSRILVAQVPGGMLTNLESQLKQQGAENKLDEVLDEIPKVRKDLGYIPLVTPTSQIVGTQAVLNVLTGERYKTVTKETEALLKGEYGSAPAPFNKELQARVLGGADPIICRPADNLKNELEDLTAELKKVASEKNIQLAKDEIDDVLIYSLFPQAGLKFLENRGNPDAFEPPPREKTAAEQGEGVYTITVNGKTFVAKVSNGGDISGIAQLEPKPLSEPSLPPPPPVAFSAATEPLISPLAGTILKIYIKPGQAVQEGSVVIVLEAMKMETEICAHSTGTVKNIFIKEGDTVATGDVLVDFV